MGNFCVRQPPNKYDMYALPRPPTRDSKSAHQPAQLGHSSGSFLSSHSKTPLCQRLRSSARGIAQRMRHGKVRDDHRPSTLSTVYERSHGEDHSCSSSQCSIATSGVQAWTEKQKNGKRKSKKKTTEHQSKRGHHHECSSESRGNILQHNDRHHHKNVHRHGKQHRRQRRTKKSRPRRSTTPTKKKKSDSTGDDDTVGPIETAMQDFGIESGLPASGSGWNDYRNLHYPLRRNTAMEMGYLANRLHGNWDELNLREEEERRHREEEEELRLEDQMREQQEQEELLAAEEALISFSSSGSSSTKSEHSETETEESEDYDSDNDDDYDDYDDVDDGDYTESNTPEDTPDNEDDVDVERPPLFDDTEEPYISDEPQITSPNSNRVSAQMSGLPAVNEVDELSTDVPSTPGVDDNDVDGVIQPGAVSSFIPVEQNVEMENTLEEPDQNIAESHEGVQTQHEENAQEELGGSGDEEGTYVFEGGMEEGEEVFGHSPLSDSSSELVSNDVETDEGEDEVVSELSKDDSEEERKNSERFSDRESEEDDQYQDKYDRRRDEEDYDRYKDNRDDYY